MGLNFAWCNSYSVYTVGMNKPWCMHYDCMYLRDDRAIDMIA